MSINSDPMNFLCQFVTGHQFEDLPSNVVRHAKRSLLDTLGVMIGGSKMDGVPQVVELVKEKGGKPESIIPFYGGKVPASEAAFAMGPMARAMDFGDVHEEALHASEYTLPSLFAATGLKNKVSGKQFLTSYILGQEVLVRIGIAFKGMSRGVPIGRSSGHYIFGCVAAVGKMLGLSQKEMANAQGIARAMTQPHDSSMYKPPTLMVRVHHGFVCQDAINACLLAQKKITGTNETLSAPKGYLGFAKWETEPSAITRDLGKKWEMLDTMMKPYMCCKCTHTAIEALLGQMQEQKFDHTDISMIHFGQSEFNWAIVCEPEEQKWNPRSANDCQFSFPYIVASAAIDKRIDMETFSAEAINREETRRLMTRISATKERNIKGFGMQITTLLKDGNSYVNKKQTVKGCPENPLSDKDLKEKFIMCAGYSQMHLSRERISRLMDNVMNIENEEDVTKSILMPLSPDFR